MPHGCNGKILRVDLSRGAISVDEPGEDFYWCYLGGGAPTLAKLQELGIEWVAKDSSGRQKGD